MFEHKTGVNDIERPPLVVAKRKLRNITLPEFDEIVFPIFLCLIRRLLELRAVPIDADDAPVRCGGPRHRPCELSKPAADVENSIAPFDPHRLERGVIEKVVEEG